jgi:type IV pilus assembly protein PilN
LIKINLLPKTLRKRVEPGWWRIIAVAFPVVTLAIVGITQWGLSNTITQLGSQRDQLNLEVNALDRYVKGQQQLNAQQRELESIVSIKSTLERDAVKWSSQLSAFVERMPRSNGSRTAVALRSLSLRRVTPQAAGGAVTYDGKNVTSEFTIQADAPQMGDIIRFVSAFENDPKFGIQFNQAGYAKETNRYQFTASIGLVGDTAPTDGTAQPGQTTPPSSQPTGTPTTTQPAGAPTTKAPGGS